MHTHLGPVVGALAALAWTGVAAQQSACSLLTAADIEAATGEKPGEPHETNMGMSDSSGKGQVTLACMWRAAAQGMVTVSLAPAAKGAAREAGLAKLTQVFDELKAQHWTEERKDIANGFCAIMTPPPSQKDVPIMSSCMAEAKGMAMSVGYMSPTKKLSFDQTKSLMDKAIGRVAGK